MNTTQQKVRIEMTSTQHKRYLAFLEADKIARGVRRALRESDRACKGELKLKSAHDLLNEL